MYGPGCGYHVFVGKDASRSVNAAIFHSPHAAHTWVYPCSGLGKSSLKPEDAVSDYSTLTEEEMKVLDDWVRRSPPALPTNPCH